MKTLFFALTLVTASLAHATVNFSAASPLSNNQKRALTRVLNARCNIQGYQVVESRTLIGHNNVYFTNFAVLSFGGAVASQIDTSINSASRVLSVRGPLCH